MSSLKEVSVIVVLIATVAFGKVIIPNAVSKSDADDFLFGGFAAHKGQFPYQALYRPRVPDPPSSYHNNTCGGAIITNRFILTAASCIVSAAADSVVVLGFSNLADGKAYDVKQVFIHPDFVFNGNASNPDVQPIYDLALIQTKRKIEFTRLISPVPVSRRHIGGGLKVVATGTGTVHNVIC